MGSDHSTSSPNPRGAYIASLTNMELEHLGKCFDIPEKFPTTWFDFKSTIRLPEEEEGKDKKKKKKTKKEKKKAIAKENAPQKKAKKGEKKLTKHKKEMVVQKKNFELSKKT